MKKIQTGWLLILVILASCQSSRFMQDDMYFVQIDAIREVREFENDRKESLNKTESPTNLITEEVVVNNDYYNYSYSSRLRRFNDLGNTWNYYDSYHTNVYWYNKSSIVSFGNSLYTTYLWWGVNTGIQNTNPWVLVSSLGTANNWSNPFKSFNTGWGHSNNPYKTDNWNTAYISGKSFWNTGLGYSSMYYNSYDRTSYWKVNKKDPHNFSSLMQKNGITRNIDERPHVEFAEIRASKLEKEKATKDTIVLAEESTADVYSNNKSTMLNDEEKVITNPNITTNTTKRWDNHNTDVKISPNSGTKNDNWSKSGVFSEGSRNNNYQYKGSAIPTKGSATIDGKKKGKKK